MSAIEARLAEMGRNLGCVARQTRYLAIQSGWCRLLVTLRERRSMLCTAVASHGSKIVPLRSASGLR
jgi:hypothetical protein